MGSKFLSYGHPGQIRYPRIPPPGEKKKSEHDNAMTSSHRDYALFDAGRRVPFELHRSSCPRVPGGLNHCIFRLSKEAGHNAIGTRHPAAPTARMLRESTPRQKRAKHASCQQLTATTPTPLRPAPAPLADSND